MLLLGVGCVSGAVFGLYGQQLLDRALANVINFPVVYSFGGLVAVTSLALVTAAAVVMVALPGYFATRVPPAWRYRIRPIAHPIRAIAGQQLEDRLLYLQSP